MTKNERYPAYAEIGLERVRGGLKVTSASVWAKDRFHDFPGTLEGMIGEKYGNEHEVKDAARQIFSDLNIRRKVRVKLHRHDRVRKAKRYKRRRRRYGPRRLWK